jgi:hypothetical protein
MRSNADLTDQGRMLCGAATDSRSSGPLNFDRSTTVSGRNNVLTKVDGFSNDGLRCLIRLVFRVASDRSPRLP